MPAVGNNVARKDGIGKATGRALYADDLVFPGMLHGRTIRSTIPCGRVKSVKLDFDLTGFTVVDHRDVPGRNIVDLIEQDQPFLVERDVRHMAEPILLLAHENLEVLNAKARGEAAVPVEDDGVDFDEGRRRSKRRLSRAGGRVLAVQRRLADRHQQEGGDGCAEHKSHGTGPI